MTEELRLIPRMKIFKTNARNVPPLSNLLIAIRMKEIHFSRLQLRERMGLTGPYVVDM
jgi:hypothetical protein